MTIIIICIILINLFPYNNIKLLKYYKELNFVDFFYLYNGRK